MAQRSSGPRHAIHAVIAASIVASLASCAARLEDGRPCAEPGTCESGRTCVAGRCRPSETAPSPPDSLRVVLKPAGLAVIASSDSGGGGPDLPETIALGRDSSGTVVMLFRFVPTWHEDAEVMSAFIVLDPIEGGPPATRPTTFEMARIVDAWRPEAASWGRQPRLAVPKTAGSVLPHGALPVRIDVTPLVRDWVKRKPDDFGIALLAHGDDVYGTAFSTGVSRGAGPRLEVYVR